MDTLTITAKVKILPSEQYIALLDATMEAYRDACIYVAEFVFKTHERHHLAVHKALYSELRHSYGLKSQMACSVIKTVLARYDTIFTAEHKWIKPVFKKQQYDLVWNRDYSLTKGIFSVNTLAERLKVPFCSGGMEKYFDSSIILYGRPLPFVMLSHNIPSIRLHKPLRAFIQMCFKNLSSISQIEQYHNS